MLDERAEEALDGAVESAVHHERLVALAVFADVLELEALGQGEVELHGGELPEAADGVDQLDVDFRAVKRGFAGDGFVLDVAALERVLERTLGQLPLIGASGVGLLVVRVPNGTFSAASGSETSGKAMPGA